MNFMFEVEYSNTTATIKVVGVGGGGINAVNLMISRGIEGVEFIAIDTDTQSLSTSQAPRRIRIGEKSFPKILDEIYDELIGANLVFIVAGMGGKTATSAVPFIAACARSLDATVISAVSSPFSFEDPSRKVFADMGIENLRCNGNTIILIPSDELIGKEKISAEKAFKVADDFSYKVVQGIAQLITMPGMVNLDFNDLSEILGDSSFAFAGIGEASGEDSCVTATQNALNSPLIKSNIQRANSVLMSITGSNKSFTIPEVNEASIIVQDAASPEAEIMWGMSEDESFGDTVRVVIIATRFN